MASIANLAVVVSARTEKHDRAFKRSRRVLGGFQKRMQSAAVTAVKFGIGLTGLGGAAGFAVLIKASFSALDALGKLSARIGESTEQLLGLQHAAVQTGASTELLSSSLDVLQKRLGEAKGGKGMARDALDTLGLSVEKLLALKPGAQIALIAQRMKGLATAAERAAVTSQLFSRAGLKLQNMLALGAEGLARYQSQMEALGATVSAAATARIEAMNDSYARFHKSVTGLANTIASRIAPALERLANFATGLLLVFRSMDMSVLSNLKSWAKWTARIVAGTVAFTSILWVGRRFITFAGFLLGTLRKLTAGFMFLQAGMGGPAMVVGLAASLVAVTGLIIIVDEAFASLEREVGKTVAEITRVGSEIGALTEFADNATKATEGLSGGLGGIGDDARDMASGIASATSALDSLAQAAQRIFSQTRTPWEKWSEGFWEATNAYNAGLISLETYDRRLKQLGQTLKDYYDTVRSPKLEAMHESIRMRQLTQLDADTARAGIQPPQRIGFGREIDIATTSIPGLAMAGKKEQKVSDQAALEELKKIVHNTQSPTPATVS